MQIKDIMTTNVDWIAPDTVLTDAARLMRDQDIGILPIGKNDELIGMLTDRDIVIKAVAEQRDCAKMAVTEAMSDQVLYVFDDQSVAEAAENMRSNQVRRLPVVDRDKRLVGIISLGDIAERSQPNMAGDALAGVAQDSNDQSRQTIT